MSKRFRLIIFTVENVYLILNKYLIDNIRDVLHEQVREQVKKTEMDNLNHH
jgi:hypothetical protein